jgi:hypothetical protein
LLKASEIGHRSVLGFSEKQQHFLPFLAAKLNMGKRKSLKGHKSDKILCKSVMKKLKSEKRKEKTIPDSFHGSKRVYKQRYSLDPSVP